MDTYLHEREESRNLSPENRRWDYRAIAIIAIVIILLLSTTICGDKIPLNALFIMRGCAGLGAVVFVLIV